MRTSTGKLLVPAPSCLCSASAHTHRAAARRHTQAAGHRCVCCCVCVCGDVKHTMLLPTVCDTTHMSCFFTDTNTQNVFSLWGNKQFLLFAPVTMFLFKHAASQINTIKDWHKNIPFPWFYLQNNKSTVRGVSQWFKSLSKAILHTALLH